MSKHLHTYMDVIVSMFGTAFSGILAFYNHNMAVILGTVTLLYTLRKWWILERKQKKEKEQ